MRVVMVALACCLALTATARADARPYRGPHPLDLEGHWHDEATVHVHDVLPVGLAPFASVDGVMVFLGDPSAYGYAGDVYTYRGAHPLPARMVSAAICGLTGEHRHPFAPEGAFSRESDGAYRFNGAIHGGDTLVVPGRLSPAEGPVAPLETTPVVVASTPICSP